MRILIIENTSILKKNNKYYTHNQNGVFVKELINCGHEMSYFNFAMEKQSSISTCDLEQMGVKVYPNKYFRIKIFTYLLIYLKLTTILLKHDFIYFYYPSSLKYGMILCNIMNKKFGVYVRGMQGVENKFSEWVYKKTNIVLTVSDYFTDKVNRCIGVKKAQTIRPMIPYKFSDIINDRVYKPRQSYQLLYLGRLDKAKGIRELLGAVKLLKHQEYRFTLKIIGAGSFENELIEKIKLLGIEESVKFEGFISDPKKKKELFLETDIYILPTYHEGFPRTLYEAMIFGAPIITTFVGGIPTLMEDHVNCLRIEPRSVNSIVEKLEYAFKNYEEMIEMAKNGTEIVEKILNPNRLTHAGLLNKTLLKSIDY